MTALHYRLSTNDFFFEHIMSSSASSVDQPQARKRTRTLYEEDQSPSDQKTLLLKSPPGGPSFESLKESPAHEFFSSIFFYNGKDIVAEIFAEERKKKFGYKTAWELLMGAKSPDQLDDILSGTGIESSPVKPYWMCVLKTLGSMLAGQQNADSNVFQVGAIVKGAKQSNGARGNVFKFVQRNFGYYSEQEGIQIHYENDDLHIQVYCLSHDAACQLQNALFEWEIHKELANLKGVELHPPTPAQVPRPADLKRIYLQDYHPLDSESPCQTLDQLHSYRLSGPATEPAEANSPFVTYQSIDKRLPHLNHYKCHLKDKAKFKGLQNNENNMVAVSWVFHQQLDGLNVDEGIPLAAISIKQISSCRLATHDNRYRVTIVVEFFYPELGAAFAAPEWSRKGDRENTWEVVVYVQDKETFVECVEWKYQDAMKQWQDHRAFLEQE